jgi:hypothetical protein
VSVQTSVLTAGGLPLRTTRALPFRLIPRIETYPKLVWFVQTIPGKIVLLAAFGGIYAFMRNAASLPLVCCLALITWLPYKRHQLVSVSTIVFSVLVPWTHFARPVYQVSLIAAALALAATFIWGATIRPRSWYSREPATTLLAGFAVWIVVISVIPWRVFHLPQVWDFTIIFGSYIWFLAYVLVDRQAVPLSKFGLEIGSLRPFWGAVYTPMPNGCAYLNHIEAKNAEQLAITQLKGLKLLAWSAMISLFAQNFANFFHDYLRIPKFTIALALSANHTPLPWFLCWACLILYFLEKLMAGAILSHRIVACCRMAGFDALRNMYRPLSSVTIAEFFNRYYFYYKELLVTFFFFPVFLRQSSRFPRLRLAVAVFAAACFGNAFFHFTRDLAYIYNFGLWTSIKSFQVFFFYCVVLAAAITFSRLRKRKPLPPGFFRGTLCPAFSVCFFYCLLSLFAMTDRKYPLVEHFRFLGHLFFIR